MCEHGTQTLLRVPIPAHLSYTRQFRWDYKAVDSCIAPIVEALNAAGIYTAGCCCGHGEMDGNILLHDGRELIIKKGIVVGKKEWIRTTVRELRGNRTLREVAESAGLSVSYLSDIEHGRATPTIETLDAIFKACGVTLTLGYTRDNPAPEYVEVKVSTLHQALSLLEDAVRG